MHNWVEIMKIKMQDFRWKKKHVADPLPEITIRAGGAVAEHHLWFHVVKL